MTSENSVLKTTEFPSLVIMVELCRGWSGGVVPWWEEGDGGSEWMVYTVEVWITPGDMGVGAARDLLGSVLYS